MGVIATEPVYAEDRLGIKRLVAAVGDVIPDEIPEYGIVTPRNTPASVVVPLDGYAEMSEEDIVAVLGTLTVEQLASVQAYEAAHLARGTIVRFGRASKPLAVPKKSRRKGQAAAPGEDFGDVAPGTPGSDAE
jgi:uncharacterized protein (DUF433 family)